MCCCANVLCRWVVLMFYVNVFCWSVGLRCCVGVSCCCVGVFMYYVDVVCYCFVLMICVDVVCGFVMSMCWVGMLC